MIQTIEMNTNSRCGRTGVVGVGSSYFNSVCFLFNTLGEKKVIA